MTLASHINRRSVSELIFSRVPIRSAWPESFINWSKVVDTTTVGGTWVSAWPGSLVRRMIDNNAIARRFPSDEAFAVGAAFPVDRFGFGVEGGGELGA